MLRSVQATRYVTPLREGGSLPAIVEADDLGLYVLKFYGAGQGPLALAAEIIAGEIGRLLGLQVPEFEKICQGAEDAGPIARLSQRERFHWLVSPRSTVIQISPVHGGLCDDPRQTLEQLFGRLVTV